MELPRRSVLVGGGLIALSGLGGAALLSGAIGGDRDGDGADEARSTTTVPPVEGIAAVGAAYLAGPGRGDDLVGLRAALPTLTGESAADVVDQLGSLREAVTADFTSDRTVEVDGWILARTEAQAAALVHLLS